MVSLIGLMITKEDHEVFGDWCEDQLSLYDAVVCLDGSASGITRRIAEEFPEQIIYFHESQVSIGNRTDHGLRGVVHEQIVRIFGRDNWIMCCHPDEFCYHNPKLVAARADECDCDLVSWYSPHFYPHPSELPSLAELVHISVVDRFHYFHWGHLGTEIPWVEDRLYRNSAGVRWDGIDESTWNLEHVVDQFRSAVEAFHPDHVIITDSWNFKPWLAEAVRPFSYILRYQALENLCPLNNIRLLPNGGGAVRQCGRHQLATPGLCHNCCKTNSELSGHLHRLDREFSCVGSPEYDKLLHRAVGEATAVLVVNPLVQAMISPWNERTYVVPSGMDPDRFTPIDFHHQIPRAGGGKKRILFAGLIDEYMKGFHILKQACDYLWSKRQDFELVATGDLVGRADEYTHFVGWVNQRDLVRHLVSSDMLVFPTIAQEALGRSAVEAMGAGIPVVASKIGGLSYTVTDNSTGLLAIPGDPIDLANKIEILLDDAGLRQTFGENGRRRFSNEFAWPVIIDRYYKPLFANTRSL